MTILYLKKTVMFQQKRKRKRKRKNFMNSTDVRLIIINVVGGEHSFKSL